MNVLDGASLFWVCRLHQPQRPFSLCKNTGAPTHCRFCGRIYFVTRASCPPEKRLSVLILGGCYAIGSHPSSAGTSSWSISSSTETQPIHGPTSGLTFAAPHVAFHEPDQRLEGFSLGKGGFLKAKERKAWRTACLLVHTVLLSFSRLFPSRTCSSLARLLHWVEMWEAKDQDWLG